MLHEPFSGHDGSDFSMLPAMGTEELCSGFHGGSGAAAATSQNNTTHFISCSLTVSAALLSVF